MKVMYDIDPKALKKLEGLAAAKRLTIGELSSELVLRILNRDAGSGPASSASSSGTHVVPPAHAAPAAAPQAGVNENLLIMLLEPLLGRFRLADTDGQHRRAVIAELSMMLPDSTAAKLIALIKQSLDG